mmetsp:Transcript_58974/g.108988  ORF Transcript_58974/g.108988 Transcript_58974/m.108988 type:complete len:548 (+) Transcript_58974:2-1645(+)
MRAEWFDACSALVAFCKHSDESVAKVDRFKGTLIRLFSMLHALALAELEVINTNADQFSEVNAFRFDVIDPEGLDVQTLYHIKNSGSRVELTFSWIQCLVVDNIRTGVLSIPPPILSRAFQEIANGMVAFHDAIKITYIPFPFPYAQTCDCLLVMHWVIVPFVTSQWVSTPVWAAIFVFIQVFIFWCLNLIAIEIENPFGTDPNDLDGKDMQEEMNRHLLLLLMPHTIRTPQLSERACTFEDARQSDFIESFRRNSLLLVWDGIGEIMDDGSATVTSDRVGHHYFMGGPGGHHPQASARPRAHLAKQHSLLSFRGVSQDTLDLPSPQGEGTAQTPALPRASTNSALRTGDSPMSPRDSDESRSEVEKTRDTRQQPKKISFESTRRNLMRSSSKGAPGLNPAGGHRSLPLSAFMRDSKSKSPQQERAPPLIETRESFERGSAYERGAEALGSEGDQASPRRSPVGSKDPPSLTPSQQAQVAAQQEADRPSSTSRRSRLGSPDFIPSEHEPPSPERSLYEPPDVESAQAETVSQRSELGRLIDPVWIQV